MPETAVPRPPATAFTVLYGGRPAGGKSIETTSHIATIGFVVALRRGSKTFHGVRGRLSAILGLNAGVASIGRVRPQRAGVAQTAARGSITRRQSGGTRASSTAPA